ncbi:MOXD1 homolog 2-like [Teleopsis dalmanni]|uniref:MOXD1 homolog 2-like n=1 Tax=Teleopsis dalmanni TaxID=139649 RepID=UPI0018CD6C4A|nr:MOXD1 homolog 2-like [Teleopsis dalmanni]
MATSKRHSSLSLSSLITLFKSCLLVSSCFLLGAVKLSEAAVVGLGSNGGTGGNGGGVYEMAMTWDHAVDLNEDFRILWTIINQDVTFEIQARTLGYVGFGFSNDGNIAGADMAIGWVDNGHTFFQDRYVKDSKNVEPLVDPSQDYILIMGYENITHTVIRFRRKLDTCDNTYDIAITNNTMRVMYMYDDKDPIHGAVSPGSLPNLNDAWRPYRSLLLTQKSTQQLPHNERSRILELRNADVELPYGDDTLFWCKMFKLDRVNKKHHIIRYEPIYDSSWSLHYLQHITVYECQGSSDEMEEMTREKGRMCMGARSIPLACNSVVASWARGSEGFSFPSEAGYPLESNQAKYYIMETHYSNIKADLEQLQLQRITDSSGLRIYITENLRTHDAGVLSVGMDSNWRHIIPPGQNQVISEGQCIEDCTAYAFPAQGINIFAVMMRTHQIGREIKLRQIRKSEELPFIAHDSNIDANYQDFRRLEHSVRSLPGDRLVAECIYDSTSRQAITLGGLTMKEESCTVLTLYYPRQKKLTTCHSLPSLPTVLQSLGIEQLATSSNPVVISLPPELAGMTLENRLLSYDWENQFDRFQEATLSGSFKPICWGARNEIVPMSDQLIGYSLNITKRFKERNRCKPKRLYVTETVPQLELPVFHDIQSNHIVEGSARSSRSSLIETLALSGAKSSSRHLLISLSYWQTFAFVLLKILIS